MTLTLRPHRVKTGGRRRPSLRRLLSLSELRSVSFPVYALVFIAGVVQAALAPLGPVYAEELGLSRIQVGALFAAASIAMVIVAFPVGVVADRLGARRLTVGAAALVSVSTLGQGLAHAFWVLLASRLVFGVAFGAVWTAGLAFLADAGPVERRSARLGATIPVTGASLAIGPAFAGLVSARFGVATPFVAMAAVAAAVTGMLVLAPEVPVAAPDERVAVMRLLRGAARSKIVLGIVAVMVVAGFSGSLTYVLVPLRLRANGMSVAAIGGVLAAAAVLFVVAGTVATRLGDRLVRPAAAGLATFALGLALALPVVSTATASLAAFLLLRATCNAVMSTIAYSLASEAGADTGIGAGSVIGLANAAWATATVVAPLAGGAIAETSSDRVAFLVLVPITLATAAWLLAGGRARARHGTGRLPR